MGKIMPPKGSRVRQTVDPTTKFNEAWREVSLKVANGIENLTHMEMTAVEEGLAGSVGTVLLAADEHVLVGMFTLFGLCLRRSRAASFPAVDDATRSWCRKIRKILAQNLEKALLDYYLSSSGRYRLLLVLTQRTDILACYTALLLNEGLVAKEHPSRRNISVATDLCLEVVGIVWGLAMGSHTVKTLTPDLITTETDFVKNSFAFSALLDAWATCCLHLLAAAEWSRSKAAGELMRRLSDVVRLFPAALECVGPPSRPALGALAYLVTAHVVRFVSLYDNGTSYGLHEIGLLDVPMWGGTMAAANIVYRDTYPPERLLIGVLEWWRHMVAGGVPQLSSDMSRPGDDAACVTIAAVANPSQSLTAALPPFNAKATLDICVRVLAATAVAGSAGPTTSTNQRGQPIPSIRRCGDVANAALNLAIVMVPSVMGRDRKPPIRLLRALWVECVRVLNAAADLLPCPSPAATAAAMRGEVPSTIPSGSSHYHMCCTFHGKWEGFIVPLLSDVPMDPPETDVPTQLGPIAAAAVAAGALPTLERLVRLRRHNAGPLCGPDTWLQLLMFGPVEQIAALIASAAKWVAAITTCTALRLMRKGGRLVPPPSICVHCNSFVIGDGVNGLPETIKSGAELLDMLVDWKKISRLGPFLGRKPAGKATGDGGGDGDGDGDGDDGDNVQGKDGVGGDATAAGARQWASLTAFAAVKLLPPLVKALQMMASKGAPPKCKFCKIGILKSVDTLMEQTMALMGCGAEWRSMLLQEIDLVGLLGAAAKILRTYAVEAKYDELTIQALTTFRTCLMRAKGAFTCQLHDLAARAPPDPVLDTPLEKADLDVLLGHVNPCGPYFLNLPASLLVLGDAQEGGQCPRLPYAYLLPSPDEIRAAMAPHCCANPACLNLEGPSEASLRQRCGDDGGVGSGGARIWYCSRECSQALSNPSYKREGRASAGGLGGVDERRGLAPSGNCISDGGGGA